MASSDPAVTDRALSQALEDEQRNAPMPRVEPGETSLAFELRAVARAALAALRRLDHECAHAEACRRELAALVGERSRR
jgi:hypothetical protein